MRRGIMYAEWLAIVLADGSLHLARKLYARSAKLYAYGTADDEFYVTSIKLGTKTQIDEVVPYDGGVTDIADVPTPDPIPVMEWIPNPAFVSPEATPEEQEMVEVQQTDESGDPVFIYPPAPAVGVEVKPAGKPTLVTSTVPRGPDYMADLGGRALADVPDEAAAVARWRALQKAARYNTEGGLPLSARNPVSRDARMRSAGMFIEAAPATTVENEGVTTLVPTETWAYWQPVEGFPAEFQGFDQVSAEGAGVHPRDYMDLYAVFPAGGTAAQWAERIPSFIPWPFGAATEAPMPVPIEHFGIQLYIPASGTWPPVLSDGALTIEAPMQLGVRYTRHNDTSDPVYAKLTLRYHVGVGAP